MEFEDSFNRLRVVVKLRQPSDQLLERRSNKIEEKKFLYPTFLKSKTSFM